MTDDTTPAEVTPAETKSGFTPPASQADLDAIIKERVARERAKFADYADLKAKAEKLDASEEAQKSELEKAVARAEKAEGELSKAAAEREVQTWRDEVAKDKGVPADVLRGTTKEELEAHADALKSVITPEKKGAAGPYVPPKGDPTNAADGAPAPGMGTLRAAYAASETER